MIHILSYNSFGKLRIAIDGEPYDYFGVSPGVREDVERRIKYEQVGKILELLETFSRTELFEEDVMGESEQDYIDKISQLEIKVSHLEGEAERLTNQKNEANQILADLKETVARLTRMLKTAQGQIDILEEKRVTPRPSAEVVKDIDEAIEASGQGGGD